MSGRGTRFDVRVVRFSRGQVESVAGLCGLGIAPEVARRIYESAPVTVKRNLARADADVYVHKLASIGALLELRPSPPQDAQGIPPLPPTPPSRAVPPPPPVVAHAIPPPPPLMAAALPELKPAPSIAAERAQRNALARALLTAGSEARTEVSSDEPASPVEPASRGGLPVPPPPDALPVLLLEEASTPPALFEEGWVPGMQTPKPEPESPPPELPALLLTPVPEAPRAQASVEDSILPAALGAPEDSIPPALGAPVDSIPPALGAPADSIPPALGAPADSIPPALGAPADSIPPALRGADSSIPPALGGLDESLPPALGSAGATPRASAPLYTLPSERPLPTKPSFTVRLIRWLEDVQELVGDPLRVMRRWATLRVEQLSPPRVRRRLTHSERFDREWAVFVLWAVDALEHLLGRKG